MGRGDIGRMNEVTLPIKKIFAISLTQKKKFKGYAVYNGEQLVFQVILPIKGPVSEWKESLLEEIDLLKRVAEDVSDIGSVDQPPSREARNRMTMVIVPK